MAFPLDPVPLAEAVDIDDESDSPPMEASDADEDEEGELPTLRVAAVLTDGMRTSEFPLCPPRVRGALSAA
jgi:hypothetical protein